MRKSPARNMQLHLLAWSGFALALAAPASPQGTPDKAPDFESTLKPDRWQEDWSWVEADAPDAPRFKNMAFGPDGDWRLTLGGEGRVRAETRDPPEFGISGQPAVNAVNFRGLVHADAHLGDHVRVFLQAGSWGQDGRKVPRIFDEAEVALQRAFADIRLTPEATLRLGRQDLFRSSSRLLFPVDIFNYQLVHDAAALRYRRDDLRVQVFHGERFVSGPGVFETRDLGGETLTGAFAEGSFGAPAGYEFGAFVLHQETDTGAFPRRAGPEERTTWIARASRKAAPWAVSAEAGLQTGTVPGADISAWAFATEITRTIDAPRKPAVTLRMDGASGNKAGTDDNETWATLAPVMGYLGRTGDYNATNVIAVYPEISFDAAPDVRVSVGGEVSWRASRGAAISAPGAATPYLPAGSAGGGLVIYGAILKARWAPGARWDVNAELTWLEPSGALKDFGGEGRLNAVISLTTRF